MKIAFVTSGYENLGIESLSAQLKKENHDVKLFFDPKTFAGAISPRVNFLDKIFDLKGKIVEKIMQWDPDIVGFSCMTHNYEWCLEIAKEIKRKKNYPVIFGGIHPTLMPEETLSQECIDMVSVGESEVSFLLLVNDLKKGSSPTNIKGIYFKRNGKIITNPIEPLVTDLDSVPFPDKAIFYEKMPAFSRISYAIMASRGCLFSCTYCCNDSLMRLYKGSNLRRVRSVGNVIEELKRAKEKYKIKSVIFYDEIFPNKIPWLTEFARRYKNEIDLPFVISYHFQLCNEECISLLKDAGCQLMVFGLQSVSERVRKKICNRFETNDQVRSATALCKKYGIDISFDHIFGLPTETEEELKEALEFYRELSPNIVYSYWLVYYPKAKIIDIAIQNNVLREEDMKSINNCSNSYYYEGAFIKNKKMLQKYELLFDLIPLVTAKTHKKICENRLIFRLLNGGYFLHFFLLFILGMKLKQRVFLNNIKLLFSRKYVP